MNQAIAERLGWTSKKVPSDEDVAKQGYDEFRHTWWFNPSGKTAPIPNYSGDLNTMHEAELAMGFNVIEGHALIGDYFMHLMRVVGGNEKGTWCAAICATGAQRAEAFLRTVGKWKEAE